MRLKCPQDRERRREDPHDTIMAPEEEVLRAGADTADFIALEEGSALIVGGLDLAHFEEIERLPLLFVRYHSQ